MNSRLKRPGGKNEIEDDVEIRSTSGKKEDESGEVSNGPKLMVTDG